MKLALSIFLVIIAFLFGFFYAGFLGAFLFGIINTGAWIVMRKKTGKSFLFRIILSVFGLSAFAYVGMMVFGLVGAEKIVHDKVEGIKKELIKAGHNPIWFIISQKRYGFYNDLLANSVKNGQSRHLRGKAIDLHVIDINGDGKYNMIDFELIRQATQRYEIKHPQAKGNIIHYFGKGYFTQHMVHIDVE
jgi:energy-coupling factor transporter transmembrane protein EcfT